MDIIWFQAGGMLVLFGLAICAVQLLNRWVYSRRRRFNYEGRSYIRVPGPRRPLFANHYEGGSFEQDDGTPVTDPALNKALEAHWLSRNRPLSAVRQRDGTYR